MKADREISRSVTRSAILAAAVVSLVPRLAAAQVPFWNEDFQNGCSQLCLASAYSGPNGAWRVTDVSAPGSAANTWFVSCAENGNAPQTCGSGCGNDASLHVGNVSNSPAAIIFCPTGDCGAAYDATNATCVSNKRAESPIINASGKTGISVQYLYIGQGQANCQDATDFEYSPDGGSNWISLAPCITTANGGCGGQGRWTLSTVALPATADNNPMIRLGFRWRNNGDGIGTDPSFAVDDVVVRHTPSTLSVEFDQVVARRTGAGVEIRWTTLLEDDTSGFLVLRSTTSDMSGSCIEAVPWIDALGAGAAYAAADASADAGTDYFYQVQELTSSGLGSRSEVVRVVDAPEAEGAGARGARSRSRNR